MLNLRGPLFRVECLTCGASTDGPVKETFAESMKDAHNDKYLDHDVRVEEVEEQEVHREIADAWN